ncbi:TPA: hypothetical protein ACH6BK_003266 [Vibrio cholerae]
MKESEEKAVIRAASYIITERRFNWFKYAVLVLAGIGYLIYLQFFFVPAYSVSYIHIKDDHYSDQEIKNLILKEAEKREVQALAIRTVKPVDERFLSAVKDLYHKPVYVVEKR